MVVRLASELCTRAKLNHAVYFRYMKFTEDYVSVKNSFKERFIVRILIFKKLPKRVMLAIYQTSLFMYVFT